MQWRVSDDFEQLIEKLWTENTTPQVMFHRLPLIQCGGNLLWTQALLMHMMSKKDLTLEEEVSVRYPKQPTTVTTANGSMHSIGHAAIYVKDLDMFVTVQFLEDYPAVLPLGKLFEEDGHSDIWKRGQGTKN